MLSITDSGHICNMTADFRMRRIFPIRIGFQGETDIPGSGVIANSGTERAIRFILLSAVIFPIRLSPKSVIIRDYV